MLFNFINYIFLIKSFYNFIFILNLFLELLHLLFISFYNSYILFSVNFQIFNLLIQLFGIKDFHLYALKHLKFILQAFTLQSQLMLNSNMLSDIGFELPHFFFVHFWRPFYACVDWWLTCISTFLISFKDLNSLFLLQGRLVLAQIWKSYVSVILSFLTLVTFLFSLKIAFYVFILYLKANAYIIGLNWIQIFILSLRLGL